MPTGPFDVTGGIDSLPGAGTQKNLHMIFVVDNSGSMRNENRMDAVNQAFRLMIPKLQALQTSVNSDFTILISIMAFNEDPEWVTTPTEISYYVHNDIPASQYVTYFSRAFGELNAKLSRSQFMNQRGKMAQPYIMLMTDGAPTDGDDYEPRIAELKQNGWFVGAQRYAVLIGQDTIHDPAARQAVSSFVDGNEESIINAADAAAIVENVSTKTLHIVGQMTQRNGVISGGEINKNSASGTGPVSFPDPAPSPFPDPFPTGNGQTQDLIPGPFPGGSDPIPGPFPGGSDPIPDPFPGGTSQTPDPEQWPVFPDQNDQNTQSSTDTQTPDPNEGFDPNLPF